MDQRGVGQSTGDGMCNCSCFMDIDFVAQPWADSENLDRFLDAAADDVGLRSISIAVAWAKRSGLNRTRAYLDKMRSNGASVEMVIGISEGGATRQGLELALELADSVYVFHDPRGRTFHPKVYLSESDEFDRLFVGSNNMTAGGLFYNYEAALRLDLPHDPDEPTPVVAQVKQWFERLRAIAAACRELTPHVYDTLITDPRYRIGDEDVRVTPGYGASHETPEDFDSEQVGYANEVGLFSSPADPMRLSKLALSKQGPSPEPPSPKSYKNTQSTPTATDSWSKILKKTDAQQPTIGSSPTGNLRLSRATQDIDHKTYFRSDFFGSEVWTVDSDHPEIEFTYVNFNVTIAGTGIGIYKLRVDHNLDRVAGQGNVPTVLKWGDLNSMLREHSRVGDSVTISRRSDGTYLLSIN